MRSRLATIAFDRGGLLGLGVTIVYLWLAPAHIVDGDNAEFATLGALGGSAHPSGYPLYLLWLRATAWLPGGSAAHTTALATALLGAASIVMLHAACRAWGARPPAASLACAVFAGAPVVMAMYSQAEVFALNSLCVAAVLWLAAQHGPLRGLRRAGALGLVAGLGLSNHLTCALVSPIGVLGVVRAAREAPRAWQAIALAAGGLAIGLAPYAYLLVAPVNDASWGHARTLGDVVSIFLRRDYGGPGAFTGQADPVPAATSLGALAAMLGRAWWYVPVLAGLAAAADRMWRARQGGESRIGWATWAASFLLAGPMLATRFDVEPSGFGLYIVERFHILPAMLLAIPIADALDRIASRLHGAIAVAVFAAAAATSLDHVRRVHTPAIERQITNVLRTLPANAVVIGVDDDLRSGTAYVQLVLGERPDVVYVHRPLLGGDWYRARIAARGLQLDELIDAALARGRAVFVQGAERDILADRPHYRFGILVRVLARGQTPPSLDEVVAINKDVYAHFELGYPRPGGDDGWATRVHGRYARTWIVLAQELYAAGKPAEAHDALDVARAFGPRS